MHRVRTLALGLFLCALGTGTAAAGGLTLGIRGGFALSDLSDVEQAEAKGSFAGGAFLSLDWNASLVLRPEALLLQRRVEDLGVPSLAGAPEIEQTYLVLPLLLGVRLSRGLVEPVLYAGASAEFEADCGVTLRDGVPRTTDCNDLEDIDTDSLQWSGVAGASVDVVLAPLVLVGDVRYTFGLTEVFQGLESTNRWNTWMVLVGVGIRLGD